MNDAVARFLEARPVGSRMWIRVHGRSMFPVLRSGDSLHVLRCAASEVRRGDIAVAKRPDGLLVAHLVISERPLVLATFRGTPDPDDTEVLGKVVAVRLATGREVEVPQWSNRALLALSGALQFGARIRIARFAVRSLRNGSAPLIEFARNRRHGPPQIRALTPEDLERATAFIFSIQDVPFDRLRADVEAGRAHALHHGEDLRAVALLGRPALLIRPHNRLGLGYERRLRAALGLPDPRP